MSWNAHQAPGPARETFDLIQYGGSYVWLEHNPPLSVILILLSA